MDAIGYTKGLVALLDSLSEGFQRRGRELDEERARLAILQSERRTILQERAESDARIAALTAERDALRTTLESRERELHDQQARLDSLDGERRTILQERADFDARITALTAERDALQTTLQARERELRRLRQGMEQAQAALEVQRREVRTLQAGMAETTRQADELRAVVRSLERQLQRAARTPAPAPGESAAPGAGRAVPQLDVAAFEAMFSDRRGEEQNRIAELTAERDSLRGTLTEREQEIDRLRQEAARGQAALEAQTREMHALRIGMAETVRQAEEIRKVLQALEREIESAGRREAVLEEALEAERQKLREAAVRASQEQRALREDLADAEGLLAEARKDIGASQGIIASLRGTVEEERSRGDALGEQLKKQGAEIAQLHATLQAAPTLLAEIVMAFERSEEAAKEPSHAEGHEAGRPGAPAQAPAAGRPAADVLAILRAVREALGEVCSPPTGPDALRVGRAMDPAELRRRAEQIADDWRRAVRTRGESTPADEPARQAHGPLPEQDGPQGEASDVQPERDAPQMATPEPPSAPAASAGLSLKILQRPAPPSGMTVECAFPASGTEPACILRGEIARINDMGLLASFEERLPEGAPMVVRFVRRGQVVAYRGRVVRVQESAGTSASHATLYHLIRFESTVAAAGEEIRSPAS